MSEIAQRVRCGRLTATGFTGFITWRVTDDGRAICPHCLTPSETVDDDTSVLTDNPDDRSTSGMSPESASPGGSLTSLFAALNTATAPALPADLAVTHLAARRRPRPALRLLRSGPGVHTAERRHHPGTVSGVGCKPGPAEGPSVTDT